MTKSAQFDELLSTLQKSGVEFILIGGLACMAHGSHRATLDVDVVYRRSPENIKKLVESLGPLKPYLRGAPPRLPFVWDEVTLEAGLNFSLETTIGAIVLLAEVAGGANFESLLPASIPIKIFDIQCKCVTLFKLIELKRAAGRPKDLEAIAELEYLLSQ